VDVGRDHAEVLGDDGQLAERRLCGVEHRPAGPGPPRACARAPRAGRHRPVGGEPAEVVDPEAVREREHAPQALDPPRVARPGERLPVVERVSPPLAVPVQRVGRRARHCLVEREKEVRVREVVAPPGRDVDRDVPEDPHAALGRVRAECPPLAGEAHLARERVLAGEREPVLDPGALARAEGSSLARGNGRTGIGEQTDPAGEGRGRRVGRAEAVRRTERKHLPPTRPGSVEPVDECERLRAQAPAGQRGRVQLDAQ
jgi:hypothetical protein